MYNAETGEKYLELPFPGEDLSLVGFKVSQSLCIQVIIILTPFDDNFSAFLSFVCQLGHLKKFICLFVGPA